MTDQRQGMKIYRAWTGFRTFSGILFNVVGFFMLDKVIEEMRQATPLEPSGWAFYLGSIAFCVLIIAVLDFSLLLWYLFEVVLTPEGVLIFRGLLRVREIIPISEITWITVPSGTFHKITWTNWEETGGHILIQHGPTETAIERFHNDEDFIMTVATRNPAVRVRRTPAD